MFCLARLYLAVDHLDDLLLDDLLLGVALAVAIPVTAFRFFTPNEVFPVAYRRGRTAHVDVTGARGEAIRQGTRDQLGFTVTGITPVGLESSAGSTPPRLRVEGGPQEYLFAKLYTKGHVRADRWYKLWRTILYGSLEDEHPFQTVRRLAEYEDYALRLLQDVGIGVARPYGIVEITPEREYLPATEFFDGAVEIGGDRVGHGQAHLDSAGLRDHQSLPGPPGVAERQDRARAGAVVGAGGRGDGLQPGCRHGRDEAGAGRRRAGRLQRQRLSGLAHGNLRGARADRPDHRVRDLDDHFRRPSRPRACPSWARSSAWSPP